MVYCFPKVPLLHFLFHVDALFVQQLPLGEGPVNGLSRGFSTRGPLPLCPGLHRVVEPEHMALPQDDAVSFAGIRSQSAFEQRIHVVSTVVTMNTEQGSLLT